MSDMDRYLCIHAHFYQPPRENPWLEAVEIQDSAHPYHDWNERVAAECYVPNTAARLLDGDGRIRAIVSNFSRISFNLGPTLLSWMERHTPEAYRQILAADRQSMEWRGGHGNALAQVYNHLIMPLASRRDKETQVVWGIEDFRHRYCRNPEGMWLAETAVDLETLEALALHGIRFTILAPRQAAKVRRIRGGGRWREVSGGRIDPARAYYCRLPSGRAISLFFYDGPISQAVAFENLLASGEQFADRLLGGFSDARGFPQLLHIATDGESYGHHHRFGEMALAYALHAIEESGSARLTNYGEFLERHPPTHEVRIFENSSWSCIHGIERWRSDCGCNSGGRPGWNQAWRGPLREALDWLRDGLAPLFEQTLRRYCPEAWRVRDAFIRVVLDRSEQNVQDFLAEHAGQPLDEETMDEMLRCLEMQRQAMLMYTSCGWFFDELSGLETVQILQYAGRAVQLAHGFGLDLEEGFLARLAKSQGNIADHRDGAAIYRKFVKPAEVDLPRVAAHYAVSSLYEDYGEETDIYHYAVRREDFWQSSADAVKLTLGLIAVRSQLSWAVTRFSFCVLSFGGFSVNGGVRVFLGEEAYQAMKGEISAHFERGEYHGIVRLMDIHFGMHTYSLMDLFRDKQRRILHTLTLQAEERCIAGYRGIFNRNRGLMLFLQQVGTEVPRTLVNAAEYVLNYELWQALLAERLDSFKVRDLLSEIDRWDVAVDSLKVELVIRHKLEELMERFREVPGDIELLEHIRSILELLGRVHAEVNLWQVQNLYHAMVQTVAPAYAEAALAGEAEAARWLTDFRKLGLQLAFTPGALPPAAD